VDAPLAPITRTPFQPLPVGVHNLAALTALPPAPTYTPWGEFLPATASAPVGELQPPVATAQPAPSFTLWVAPDLPEALRARLAIPYDFTLAESLERAMLRLQISPERPVSRWIYALVAPFPTVVDGVSLGDLQAAWRGQAGGPFAGRPLLMDEDTRGVFSALWGEPAASAVLALPSAELVDRAWKNRPAWAIVPFEAIEPRWKTLLVDGQSPLHKDFDPAAYPLSVPVSLLGEQSLAEVVTSVYGAAMLPASNRDPQRLTVLAMTGVTALVRATAYAMERQGVTYPAGDVVGWLSQADITHISNEVPFAQGCPFPDPFQQGVRFCSDPRYIELLQVIGTDVVELTGDHFHDWGVEAMHFTLGLYRQLGWPYYGGGENIEDGRKALLMEHNGNRLAFIGCNGKGGSFAQAGPDHPGSAACGFDFMESEITRLRGEGILPIATFQHFEYYTYQAQPDQQRDFRRMAQAGAVIVSGSQAHQPQGLELLNGALIHYGLGNLFFDQYEVSLATRQGFIDRHVFYDGRYLGVELLSILFIDYARPRPMTASERLQLLESVFAASGW
jgi:poly-gamma-glutamate synthesis protein (capsule biosynthesis protein)